MPARPSYEEVTAATSRASGAARRCYPAGGWGGGGGGGWKPGGGGGGGVTAGAGGGGGSGHAPPGSASVLGPVNAHGQITVTYLDPSTDWVGLGSTTMTSAPTTAARPHTGKLAPIHDLFYLDANSQVIQRVVTEGVPGPEHNLGAVLYPGSTIAAIWTANGQRLDLFGRGTESALWQKTYTLADGWGAWHSIPDAGTLTSDPAAASLDGSRLDVFYRGTDHSLRQLPLIDGQPRAPISLGGNLDTAPAAISKKAGLVEVFTDENIGAGRHVIVHRSWTGAGWLRIPDDPSNRDATSTPTVSSPDTNTITIAFRTNDAGISTSTNQGTWSPWRDLTAPSPAGSPPALQSTSGGAILYLRGNDNRLTARILG